MHKSSRKTIDEQTPKHFEIDITKSFEMKEEELQDEGGEEEIDDENTQPEEYEVPDQPKKKRNLEYLEKLTEDLEFNDRVILIHHMNPKNLEFTLQKIY